MVVRRAGFSHRGYADGALVLHGARKLTSPTSGALFGIDSRALDGIGNAVGVHELDGFKYDRFWTRGAPFFADDARSVHGPGKAASSVNEGCAQAGGRVLCVSDLLRQRKLHDGSRGAYLPTQSAGGLTVSDFGNENWGPHSFETRLDEGWVKGVVGADTHALAAADAAGQEVLLGEGAGGANATGHRAIGGGDTGAHGGNRDKAAGRGHEQLSAIQMGAGNRGWIVGLRFTAGEKLEGEGTFGACCLAVQAEMAFFLMPDFSRFGVVPSLAGELHCLQ